MYNVVFCASVKVISCILLIRGETLRIEHFHIHSNKNDLNNIRNFSNIMPYLRRIVVQPLRLRDVVLQFASFLKGKDMHHIRYSFPYIRNNHLSCLKCRASINFD